MPLPISESDLLKSGWRRDDSEEDIVCMTLLCRPTRFWRPERRQINEEFVPGDKHLRRLR